MNETTLPQPTRRGFFGVLGTAVAALAWSPLKTLWACAPSKAAPVAQAISAGVIRRNPYLWLGGVAPPDELLELTPGQLANMQLSGCLPSHRFRKNGKSTLAAAIVEWESENPT